MIQRKAWIGATAAGVTGLFICNVAFVSLSFLRNDIQIGEDVLTKVQIAVDYPNTNTSLSTKTPTRIPLPTEQSVPKATHRTKYAINKPILNPATILTEEPTAESTSITKHLTRKPSPTQTLQDASPILVLHIGPHKTGTSTIQCDLTHYRRELYANASVAYTGRAYKHCMSRNSTGLTFDTRGLINNCFKSSLCTKSDNWKNLEAQLHYYSYHDKSVIISDEAFSRMRIIAGDNVDNRVILYRLFNKYYPGRVHVVIIYRRYYEWMQSLWNEGNKPHSNIIFDPNSPYKKKFEKWPSEGGKTCKTFLDYITRKRKKNSRNDLSSTEYQKLAEVENIHVVEYLRRLWSNHSSEVLILNMHEMQHNDDGEDLTTRLLREVLPPLAGNTFKRAKVSGFTGRPNPSRNFDYDRLAVKAHERGLLANQTTTARFKIAEMAEKYLLRKLNTTMDKLPLVCLNETHLQNLLQKSLQYENQMYPNQSEESARHHELVFFEAVERKQFCNFDTDKLIEDHAVQSFFTEYIPQLLSGGSSDAFIRS